MTAAGTLVAERADVVRSPMRSLIALGLREAKRIVFSPALLIMASFALLTGNIEAFTEGASAALLDRAAAYETLIFFSTLYVGLIFYIAAHLVTSSARRTHADRQLAASPMSERMRGGGQCLGAIIGPGVVAVIIVVALALLGNDLVLFGVGNLSDEALGGGDPPFELVQLLQIGVTLVGGALFGVLWATWLRFPGSLPIGLVVLVFGTGWLLDENRSPVNAWPWFAPYISSPGFFDAEWTSHGSHSWHLAYIIGLCALAVCGVMLRQREGRSRWAAIAAGILLTTVAAGWMQLS